MLPPQQPRVLARLACWQLLLLLLLLYSDINYDNFQAQKGGSGVFL